MNPMCPIRPIRFGQAASCVAPCAEQDLFAPRDSASARSTALDAWYTSDAGRRFINEFLNRVRMREITGRPINGRALIEELRLDGYKIALRDYVCPHSAESSRLGASSRTLGINNNNVKAFLQRLVADHPEVGKHFHFRSRP